VISSCSSYPAVLCCQPRPEWKITPDAGTRAATAAQPGVGGQRRAGQRVHPDDRRETGHQVTEQGGAHPSAMARTSRRPLKAGNREIVASGEGYSSKSAAKQDCEAAGTRGCDLERLFVWCILVSP
jgi:hypothetical protein